MQPLICEAERRAITRNVFFHGQGGVGEGGELSWGRYPRCEWVLVSQCDAPSETAPAHPHIPTPHCPQPKIQPSSAHINGHKAQGSPAHTHIPHKHPGNQAARAHAQRRSPRQDNRPANEERPARQPPPPPREREPTQAKSQPGGRQRRSLKNRLPIIASMPQGQGTLDCQLRQK